MKFPVPAVVLFSLLIHAAHAQVFVTGVGGVSALSGASASAVQPPATSSYSAATGAIIGGGAGFHVNDWFSVQATYLWNRNLVSRTQLTGGLLLRRDDEVSQASAGVDGLVYFRGRASRLRPWLSAGPALVRSQLPAGLRRSQPGLRVAVGIDVMLRSGWGFRYSFNETMTGNALGAVLQPAAGGKLMNFQNLFGLVKVF